MRQLLIIVFTLFSVALFAQRSEVVEYDESGNTIVIGVLENGQEAVVKKYDAKGNLSETGYYSNGLKHRTWSSYNSNEKQVALASFNHGAKDGKWLIWDNQGYIRYEIHYKNNRINSAYELDRDGLLVAELHK